VGSVDEPANGDGHAVVHSAAASRICATTLRRVPGAALVVSVVVIVRSTSIHEQGVPVM